MSSDQAAERRRRALLAFIERRGLQPNEWAKRAGLPTANSIYNLLRGESQSLSQKTLEKLARAEGVPISELTGESLVPADRDLVRLQVVGAVQAGHWAEAVTWPAEDRINVTLPAATTHRSTRSYLLLIRGESMNVIYPHGTLLEVVDLPQYEDVLKNGNKVIVYRVDRHGLIEATCKELQIENGRAWLWPKSKDPNFQQPISVPWPPEDGETPREDGIEEIRIQAVVIRSIKNEV